ncbi:MAG TPA: TrkH family potassium uptake protein [Gammaproteobacteria bacterium]|nr:TrkH family potassium uptake protein [Gammaproteobacteria bacterium]
MRYAAIARILGLLVLIFGASMLPPLGVSLWYHDGEAQHFLASILVIVALGLALWLPTRHRRAELRTKDGFIIVALFWVVLGCLGALPFMFGAHLSFVDSLFESVSGFTTTGATVIQHIDNLPPSILYHRQQIQLLGGMGVVVLAVAVLPMLGVGGMQLYRAETPGPMKDEKITPRIAHTSRALWLIYFALTAACAFAYWLAGMKPFDAIGNSFSTLSTGGFSMHDASLGYYNSPAIEAIADVFMLAGGMNFTVHFMVWRGRNPMHYFTDPEVRTFLVVVAVAITLITIGLAFTGYYGSVWTDLRYAAFQVISVITSTGFTTANFSVWPLSLPVLLILSSFIGGCAGSTAGGMKVIRVLLLGKQATREITRLVHPNAVMQVKLGGRTVPERTMAAVWAFFSAYVAAFAVLMLAMISTGVDQVTAFSAIATCMNNLGPGLGKVAANFHSLNDTAKIISVIAMLLGRLEIFTILVLLSPAFWRN